MTDTGILRAVDLSKNYCSGDVVTNVLRDINISFQPESFTVIMGPSGSGKSTLMHILSGMDKPASGQVCFCGEMISTYSNNRLAIFRRTNCGFVFQQIFLLDHLSLLDNVIVCGLLRSKNKADVLQRAKLLFEKVGVNAATYKKFPNQVSGGEAQRAAVVRALINSPRVLFADEPTGALDSSSGRAVLDVLTAANRDKLCVIMVTHDINSACRGDRVLYLKDGKFCAECSLGAYEADDPVRLKKLQSFLEEVR